MKLLIDRGADVNAKDQHKNSGDAGVTVLDLARRNGNPAIIELLEKSGAKATPEVAVTLKPRHSNTIRNAVQDSLPRCCQRSDVQFPRCQIRLRFPVSNNSMAAMTVNGARADTRLPD